MKIEQITIANPYDNTGTKAQRIDPDTSSSVGCRQFKKLMPETLEAEQAERSEFEWAPALYLFAAHHDGERQN